MVDTPITQQLVIVTDLDGSLLDHHTYSHAEADEMLAWLEQQAIPVILCTSKTASEVEHLRTELGNSEPFIVENGAAVFIPSGYFQVVPGDCVEMGSYLVKEFCPPRRHWLSMLEEAKAHFPNTFDHFANMSIGQVAELTGLSRSHASRAQERGYGEPLQWIGDSDQLEAFTEWCEARGANVLRGGRFVHVSGRSDKGRALSWLIDQYRANHPQREVVSLALGDGHNDVAMLRQSDLAVVIRSPVHEPPVVDNKQMVYTTLGLGPAGWTEGVDYWIQELRNRKNTEYSER